MYVYVVFTNIKKVLKFKLLCINFHIKKMTIIFTYHHTNIGRESSRKWKRGGGLDRPKSLFKKGSALGRFCHLTAHNDVLRFENADPVCSRVKLLLSLTSRIKKNCHRVDTNVFYRMLMGSRDKTRQRSLASLASLSVDNVLPHVPVLDMSAIASPVPQLLWITFVLMDWRGGQLFHPSIFHIHILILWENLH